MNAALLMALLALFQPQAQVIVSGTVVDATGGTVPDATVQLEVGGVVVLQALTARDGQFSFLALPTDRIRVIVTAPGFAPRMVDVGAGASQLTIELEPAPFFDAVQVTSSRGKEPQADPTVAASVLGSTEILSAPAAAVDDILKVVPGFTLFPSSRVANPTTQTMMMRGLGGSGVSRSLVLADGVPLNDAFGGWVYWDKVPHAAIDRIEIVRGGGSDLYGADAVGGVVQVLTIEPSKPIGRILIEGGNLETGRASAFGGSRNGPWGFAAGGQWYTTGGYVLIRPVERGAIDRPSSSKHRSAIGAISYSASDTWRLGLKASLFSEDRNNGTVLQVNDTDARLFSGDARGAVKGGFLTVRAFAGSEEYNQTFSDIEEEPPRSDEVLKSKQRVPSHSAGASAQYAQQWGGTSLLLGGETRVMTGHTNDTSYDDDGVVGMTRTGGSERLGAGFARARIAVTERMTFVAGVHGDAWHSSSDTSSFSQTVGSFSPRLSIAYRAGDSGVVIRGVVFGGFRAPTLNELYRSFQVGNDLTLPNEKLTPERLKSAEAGVTFSRSIASIRVTGFWSVLDDAVTNVTVATSPGLNVRTRENADRIRSRGLEFEGDVRLSRPLSVAVTGALIDSRFQGTVLHGFRVPQVPNYSVVGTFRYRDPEWTGSAQIRLVGSQFDDDVNTRLLDRAAVVDVFAGRTIARRTLVFVALENLFDADYDAGKIPESIAGLPRAVRAGVQFALP
ncbi:MAG TPA: TonB-dependent receptor [Vicinamibacterales bacterium]